MRNSNLLPVKAKGDVRLRSVASRRISGSVDTPTFMIDIEGTLSSLPAMMCSTTAVSCSPRNIEMIAGGASFEPRRWSLPGFDALMRSSPACSSTAFITAASISRKQRFFCGSLPGLSRLRPVSVPSDQLLCLPLPLTPANGFSCSRHTSPCRRATFFMTFMTSMFSSVATFVVP